MKLDQVAIEVLVALAVERGLCVTRDRSPGGGTVYQFAAAKNSRLMLSARLRDRGVAWDWVLFNGASGFNSSQLVWELEVEQWFKFLVQHADSTWRVVVLALRELVPGRRLRDEFGAQLLEQISWHQ